MPYLNIRIPVVKTKSNRDPLNPLCSLVLQFKAPGQDEYMEPRMRFKVDPRTGRQIMDGDIPELEVVTYESDATLKVEPGVSVKVILTELTDKRFTCWSGLEVLGPNPILELTEVYQDALICPAFEGLQPVPPGPTPPGPVGPTHVVTLIADPMMGIATGSGVYEEGSTVVIKAGAFPGYQFLEWSDGSTDPVRTISMDEDFTATANFEMIAVPEPKIGDVVKATNGQEAGVIAYVDDEKYYIIYKYCKHATYKSGWTELDEIFGSIEAETNRQAPMSEGSWMAATPEQMFEIFDAVAPGVFTNRELTPYLMGPHHQVSWQNFKYDHGLYPNPSRPTYDGSYSSTTNYVYRLRSMSEGTPNKAAVLNMGTARLTAGELGYSSISTSESAWVPFIIVVSRNNA